MKPIEDAANDLAIGRMIEFSPAVYDLVAADSRATPAPPRSRARYWS